MLALGSLTWGRSETNQDLIGRDREQDALLGALRRACDGAHAVVLEGEAGIGKTALWRWALERARAQGWRILYTAPTGSEARLAFAALGDLLDRQLDGVAEALARPQRIALERALLRRGAAPGRTHIDERIIGVATLSCLRALAARGPLVVAIDDLQWVDPASAAVLRFALRRLEDEPVLILAARRPDARPGRGAELERILSDERVQRLHVPALTVGALHDLLATRLGFDAPRQLLLRLHELTAGNAFFALEIARELIRQALEPSPAERLPVPGSVRELVQARFERVSRGTRRVLLATAALGRPTRSLLIRFDPEADAALAEAQSAGVLELVSGERVLFAHPMFASIVYEEAPLADRRRLHTRLSELVEDLEERARHLALATCGLDDAVAAELDAAARAAGLRGAPAAAAELCDLAARLTADPTARAARVLVSAEHHRQAGDLGLATDRASEALRTAREPEMRARALIVLGTMATDSDGIEAGLPYFRRARRERGVPASLRADVHHKLAWMWLVAADARKAQRHAVAMMRLTDPGDAPTSAAAAITLSHVEVARGQPVPRDLLDRALALQASSSHDRPWTWDETAPSVMEGAVLLWGGELEQAQVACERVLEEATERGHLWVEMMALAYLSAVRTGLGRPAAGLQLAERYLELANMVGQDAHRAGALWPVAVAASWLGETDRAREAAREGLAIAQRTGHRLYVLGNLSVLGAVHLSLGEAEPAAGTLLQAWEMADRGGIAAPARFHMLSNAVEALVLWALALAQRCRGMVADDAAAFTDALDQHARQDRPLDRARTLLAYGALLRRNRRKSAAREALEQAASTFEACGAAVWCSRAREELGRIGGRQGPAVGALSATEAAIAARVAAGQSNREVAAALHLSARTVEWNLSRVYRKLGVRSRTQLAVALGEQSTLTKAVKSSVSPG